MTRRLPSDTTVRDAAALFRLWQALLGDGDFARRSVWLLFLDRDGRPEPVIVPIDDVPRVPGARFVDALGTVVGDLLETGDIDSVALLLSRPGRARMDEDDRRWARALAAISPRWPVHLATAGGVAVFAVDDLVTRESPSDAA